MPKITITEKDLTSPGMLNATSNTVYVPGYSTKVPAILVRSSTKIPLLYDSLSAFQADFGDSPATLKTTENALVYDTGYIYAAELLRLGVPVLYDCYVNIEQSGTSTGTETHYTQKSYDVKVTDVAGYILNRFVNSKDLLCDKGAYNFKFICSGGYVQSKESYDIGIAMASIAATRTDCVALIDHSKSITANSFIGQNGLTNLPAISEEQSKYSTMFTPWAIYTPPAIANAEYDSNPDLSTTTIELPASFGYLLAFASAIKSNPSWLAMAGAQRGIVPYIQDLVDPLPEAVADKYSYRDKTSINPIVNVNPFGLIIWGNRTLYSNPKGNLTASSFLNIRNLCSDIKKTVWTAARRLTFEQNSDILWINFKSLITPLLDQMVSGNGLSGYQLKKRVSKQKAELRCVIRLYAIEAVEDFDIEIQLADSTTAILE